MRATPPQQTPLIPNQLITREWYEWAQSIASSAGRTTFNNVTIESSIFIGSTFSGTIDTLSPPLSIANGGTGANTKTGAFGNLSPLNKKGDVLIHDGTINKRLAIGDSGQVLGSLDGSVQWVDGLPLTTLGDIVYHDGTTSVRLGIGSEGQHLKVVSGIPVWVDDASNEYYEPLTNGDPAMPELIFDGTGNVIMVTVPL